ncbi:MAG: S-layer homology domain-containing protein, partial [Candidatus Gracilibacteria bacterium]|nr:S-layer homology domain-containing protein [Candidatus Gracilibacteria bacterium]
QFRDLPTNVDPSNTELYFTTRVMYQAYISGIITGDGEGNARPLDPVIRIDALAILMRAAIVIPSDFVEQALPYNDTANNQWYSRILSFASEKSIVGGLGDGTFKPLRHLKRSEMSKLLVMFMLYNQDPAIQRHSAKMVDFYGLK